MPINESEETELSDEQQARARKMYEIYLGKEGQAERDLSDVKRFIDKESPGSLEDFDIG